MESRDNLVIPRWLQVLIALLAANVGLFCLVIWIKLPANWSSFLKIPILYARIASIGAAFIVTALALLIWLRPDQPIVVKAHRLLAQVRRSSWSLVLPLVPLVLTGIFLPSNWLIYTLLGSGMLLTALMLYLHDERVWSQPTHKWIMNLAIMLLLTGLAIRVWFMVVGYFGDEGFYLSAAQNMVNGGGIAPASTRMPDAVPNRPDWGLTLALYGFWAQLFGVSEMSLRYLGYLLGLISLALIYRAVRNSYGHQPALISAAVVTTSLLGNQTVSGRNNALPMLAFALVLVTHLEARKQNRWWLHVLTGILAAFSLETHLLNLTLIAALGGVYAVEYLQEAFQSKRLIKQNPLWSFLAGSIFGLAIYLYVHIFSLPAPQLYLDYLGRYSSSSSIFLKILSPILSLPEHFGELWEYAWVELALIVISIAAALWRGTAEDRHWLWLLVCHEIGYGLFHPIGIRNLGYTSFAMPLFAFAIGALVIYGFERQGTAPLIWQRLSLLVIAVAMIGSATIATRQSAEYREIIDNQVAPIMAGLQENVPAGSVIVAQAYIHPYVLSYDVLYPPAWAESQLAAAVIGQETDDYWSAIYLETLPQALLDSHFFPPRSSLAGDTLMESYFTSRHAIQVADHVWVVRNEPLIIDYKGTDAALEINAHLPLPDSVSTGILTIETLWTIHERVQADAQVIISFRDQQDDVIDSEEVRVVSGWQGEPTSEWRAFRFHDVKFELDTSELNSGQYVIWLEIKPASLCEECTLDLGSIRIDN